MTDASSFDQTSKKRKWTWLRLFLVLLLILIVGPLGWFGFKLATGPVSIPFASSMIDRLVPEGQVDVSVFDVKLDLTAEPAPLLTLRDINIALEGEVAGKAFIPSLSASLVTSSLWTGHPKITAATAHQPRIDLLIPKRENAPLPKVRELVQQVHQIIAEIDRNVADAGLQRFEVTDGDLALDGLIKRNIAGLNISFIRSDQGQLHLALDISGHNGPWSVEAVRRFDPEKGGRFVVRANDLTVRELVGPEKTIKPGKGGGLPFMVQIDTAVDSHGQFERANLVGRSQNGWVQLGRSTVSYDDVAVSLSMDKSNPSVRLDEFRYEQGRTSVNLAGAFNPPEIQSEPWTYALRSNYSAIGPSDIAHPSHVLESAFANGRLSIADRTIFFDGFGVKSGDAKLQGAGSLQVTDQGPYLALAIDAEKIPFVMAQQLWPITLVPPARKWIIKHVKGGLVERARFTGGVQPPAFDRSDPDPGWGPKDLSFSLDFQKARLAPIGEIPDIHSLRGSVVLADGGLFVSGEDGIIDSTGNEGAAVAVPNASFAIANVRIRNGKIGELDVDMTGKVRDIGNVMNSKPFRVLEKTKISYEGVSGTGDMNIKASFGVDSKVKLSEVKWQASAKARRFSSPNPILGHTIKSADISLEADPSQVKILGDGNLDGLPADIDLVLPLEGSSVAVKQDVGVDISVAQLKERGVDLTDFLSGKARLEIAKEADGQRISANLKNARISIDALGWSKERGVPANAEFSLKSEGSEQKVRDFVLRADGVHVEGSLSVDSKGELKTASFSKFQLRPDDRLTLSIQRGAKGVYKVAMVGDQLDARGLIRQIRSPGTQGGQGEFKRGISVTANIDRVIGNNSERIDDFTGKVDIAGSDITGINMTGRLKGNAPFRFVMEPFSRGRTVNGQFGNSGAMLSFLDLFDRMRGGQGELDVVMSSETQWTGQFNIKKLSIANDPALERLKTRERLRGGQQDPGQVIVHTRQNVEGSDASFETLEIDFVRDGDTINITKGALQGAAFGGTVSGDIDLNTQTLDMVGTFVPIYALNNAFAKIPLLGFALGGGGNEGGLIGVTYKLSGELADPVLTVNPVSAIAPGIFRRMFEFQK
ncbi:hypothetical protein TRICHSKD4_0524 [Roseibium sp. TrichSKD4]|uniref:AsmA-like C-terminal domain-containing protein n=1 Tax=Roseibium sp. TrichSKD4 TaxID=744980 RepID=UPI0001E56503|nr:AsmA-like C-terminal domain-containing protein [Roseibium sp. TrichSKD4]EFO34038.1 hypothetical protein TRICHSKD4_0524 [Roseibium sp. TrichSKD4]